MKLRASFEGLRESSSRGALERYCSTSRSVLKNDAFSAMAEWRLRTANGPVGYPVNPSFNALTAETRDIVDGSFHAAGEELCEVEIVVPQMEDGNKVDGEMKGE